jgi:PAS domain S-box-containing protein
MHSSPGRPSLIGVSVADAGLLAQSEARFRALAQATGQIYWVADAEGHPTNLTAWRAFTGQTLEEASGTGWMKALHPDDHARNLLAWIEALATKRPFCCEGRLRRADGQYRTMLVQACPVLDANGMVREWVGVNMDVTLFQELHAEVQSSQEEFKATFEQAAVGIAHVRFEDGRVLRANQKLCEILGYTQEELLSHTFQQLTYGPDLDANLVLFERLLAGELSTYTLEKRYVRKDGSLVWANLTTSVKRDQAGNPEYGIAVVEDISLRKAAEEALRQSEQQQRQLAKSKIRLEEELRARAQELETIFASLSDGLMVIGDDGQVLKTNPAYKTLVGWPAGSAFYTMSPEERLRILHIRDEQGQPLSLDQLPTTRLLLGETFAKEQVFRRQDGRDVYVSVRGAPLTDAAGRATGGVVVLHDVTARRQLEQQRHEALTALLHMAELLVQQPEGHREQTPLLVGRLLAELACSLLGCPMAIIITLDPQTLMMQVLATVGYPPTQVEHLHTMIASWVHTPPDLTDIARLMAGETLVLDVSQPPYHEYAAPFEVRRAVVAPMRLRGQLIGLVVFNPGPLEQKFTEPQIALAGATAQLVGLVVERERLLREREEARANALALQETNRQLDTFLGMASHELRTPLASLKLSLQMMSRSFKQAYSGTLPESEPPAVARLQSRLEMAERHVWRLERLVKDLLHATRIKEGKLELRLERTDLCRLVQEVVDEQRQLAPERLVQFHTPAEQIFVLADSDQIRQAAINYLNNALRYSPEAAPVLVGVEQETEQVRVWVRDHGPGIPPEEQPRIWERFHQVSGIWEQSGPRGGLGLGLYVTRMVVERHGGQVGVHSAPGRGSIFWFTVPLMKAGPGAPVE